MAEVKAQLMYIEHRMSLGSSSSDNTFITSIIGDWWRRNHDHHDVSDKEDNVEHEDFEEDALILNII